MSDYRIVVLDIGKTNKKLFVYDSSLCCLNPEEEGTVIPSVVVEGLRCEDTAGICRWMLAGLRRAAAEYRRIRCISVTTHGATIALLGTGRDRYFPGDGGLVFPIVSYEQDLPAEEESAFYEEVGLSPEQMQRVTGTARLGWLLNCSKQVFWLRRRFPRRFAEVRSILMFPQYIGYLLTGERAAEPTYLGCHSYLLDIEGDRYSVVADRLGVLDLLPPLPLRATWERLGTIRPTIAAETGLSPDCIVTLGAHDSNAALVPYFRERLDRFVLQDSGTWVVTMAPTGEARFADDELGREVFFNRSIYGRPVKTTIFRGGAEFEFYREKVLSGKPHPEAVDARLVEEILRGRRAFALPTVEPGSGLFPRSVARLEGLEVFFRDPATAWCVVDLGLAIQGREAVRIAAGPAPERIYIEGNIGRRNPLYRAATAGFFPGSRVYFAGSGGAALGAAILGVAAVEGRPPEQLEVPAPNDLQPVPPLDVDPCLLEGYAKAFLERLR